MSPYQKGSLGLLLILCLTMVSALGFSYWSGWVSNAEQPIPSSTPAHAAGPTRQPVAVAPQVVFTLTPFQPVTELPTSTATPLPTFTASPTATPLPTATQTPDHLDAVFIEGIWGYPQAFNLSCESRSAADLARYFGVSFTELEFLYALPDSDNPDRGFVGDVRGYLGQLPPYGYGVHAGPVADLMGRFGLNAEARTGLSLVDLKRELSAGRPVMIWAISDMGYSEPVEYEDSKGEISIVARFEHTFIVIGYDENYVTVLDNEKVYSVTNERFLRSWGTLGNMGIIIHP